MDMGKGVLWAGGEGWGVWFIRDRQGGFVY